MRNLKSSIWLLLLVCTAQLAMAQSAGINWTADGLGYIRQKDGGLVKVDPKTEAETPMISREQLTPAGLTTPLRLQKFDYSNDKTKVLLFTNTARVWRYNTRGDYWVLNTAGNKLTQLHPQAHQ
jgi:dipeptidyl-peptidase 4